MARRQDDYQYWHGKNEADNAGKLVLVRRSGEDPEEHPHHIFFDDNVERDFAHIVDVRDDTSGEAVAFKESLGMWLVRAEPIHAIEDDDYFINAIAGCEGKLQSYLDSHFLEVLPCGGKRLIL